jgi:hypothetical protein
VGSRPSGGTWLRFYTLAGVLVSITEEVATAQRTHAEAEHARAEATEVETTRLREALQQLQDKT